MPLRNNLESYLNRTGVEFSETMLDQLEVFAGEILKYNLSLNLVSRRNPKREVVKQIADGSVLTRFITAEDGNAFLDIGSGGGIPGIVLKILWPGINLISLDCNPRKITFQTEVARILNFENSRFIDLQFQEYLPDSPVDYITVKGLGLFKKTLAFADRALRKEGRLIYYLGEKVPAEIRKPKNAAFEFESDDTYSLPDYAGNHHLIKLIKIK